MELVRNFWKPGVQPVTLAQPTSFLWLQPGAHTQPRGISSALQGLCWHLCSSPGPSTPNSAPELPHSIWLLVTSTTSRTLPLQAETLVRVSSEAAQDREGSSGSGLLRSVTPGQTG